MNEGMEEDSIKMLECYKICTKTINHCLKMGGDHASAEHINLLMDCAKICQLAADFAIRGSVHHAALCQLCAQICRECADECEAINSEDEEMKECAQICRECADACERMSNS